MRSERQDTHRTEYLCRFCGLRVVDGSEEAGAPPESQPAWMTPDGDFGCDPSPETSEDGVGGHAVTAEEEERARAWAAEHNTPDDFEEWARRDLEAKGLSPEKAAEVVRNTYGGPEEIQGTPKRRHITDMTTVAYGPNGEEIPAEKLQIWAYRAVVSHEALVEALRRLRAYVASIEDPGELDDAKNEADRVLTRLGYTP